MNFLKLYHFSPYPLKVIAATFRGYYLNYWRYGGETENLVQEALERDTWTHDQWKHYREERLAFILHRAVTRVPYYREHWELRRRMGDRSSWEILENWPVLSKNVVRADPNAFLADDCSPKRMFCDHTSGTSGTPLKVWESRRTVQSWYALFEARIRRWNGISRADRWAILGGQLVAPVDQPRPPYWVWNAGSNQMYCSAYHLADSTVAAYAKALSNYGIMYVLGYPSALYSLCESALRQGIDLPQMRVAISNAEPLLDRQREVIEDRFRCPIVNTYGMAEIVCAASECSENRLHLWPEVGISEDLRFDSDEEIFLGNVGRFVCTGLLNPDFPLIRYDTRDTGSLVAGDDCRCHRRLPILASIEGRVDDLILTPDGRKVGRLDSVFKADLPVREAQIIQNDLCHIEVNLVPGKGFSNSHERDIAERLQQRLGKEMQVTVNLVNSIPRSPLGKFKAVISAIRSGNG